MDDTNSPNQPNIVPNQDPAPPMPEKSPVKPVTEEKPLENSANTIDNSGPISFVAADSSMPPMGLPIKADEPPEPKKEEVIMSEPKTDDLPPTNNLGIPPVIAVSKKPKGGKGKVLATVFAVLLMVVAVGAGVFLTQRNQDIREKALTCTPGAMYCLDALNTAKCAPEGDRLIAGTGEDCGKIGSNYICYGGKCIIPAPAPSSSADTGGGGSTGGGNSGWPPDGIACYKSDGVTPDGTINGCIIFHCPEGCGSNNTCGEEDPGVYWEYGGCAAGVSAIGNTCGQVDTVNQSGRWCQALNGYTDGHAYCDVNCVRPDPTDRPDIPTDQPTLPQCLNIKAYNNTTDWTVLSSADLSTLKAGDIVIFTVSGNVGSAGTFDKARFTVGGVVGAEVTDKKPGTNEFYYEYTIPAGVTSFSIKAELHHSTYGWF